MLQQPVHQLPEVSHCVWSVVGTHRCQCCCAGSCQVRTLTKAHVGQQTAGKDVHKQYYVDCCFYSEAYVALTWAATVKHPVRARPWSAAFHQGRLMLGTHQIESSEPASDHNTEGADNFQRASPHHVKSCIPATTYLKTPSISVTSSCTGLSATYTATEIETDTSKTFSLLLCSSSQLHVQMECCI